MVSDTLDEKLLDYSAEVKFESAGQWRMTWVPVRGILEPAGGEV
jgi:hypothetical protein